MRGKNSDIDTRIAVFSLFRRRAAVAAFCLAAMLAHGPVAAQDVRVVNDVAYRTGANLDEYERERSYLDLYLPAQATDFPVLVWFYGGALTAGSRDDDLHVRIATSLAQRGVAVAAADYRLSPRVSFPAYVEDAAASVAWVLENISEYGADPDRVFVSGHSAGAYLVSMIGLDSAFLGQAGASPDDLAGLIPISGQAVTHSTVRNERGDTRPGMIVDVAAPLFHVSADAPPILAIAGSEDLAARPEENELFIAALKAAEHSDASYLEFEGRTHGSIVTQIPEDGDPVASAIVDFIARH